MTEQRVFPILATVTLGTHRTPEDLYKALVAANVFVDPWWLCEKVFNRIEISPTRVDMDLIISTIADLGFDPSRAVARSAVYDRVAELGFQLCPAEAGIQLLLQSPVILQGNNRVIMEPILDTTSSRHCMVVFDIGRHTSTQRQLFFAGYEYRGPQLSGPGGEFEAYWLPQYGVIFVQPRT